jgi:hypothetical protein
MEKWKLRVTFVHRNDDECRYEVDYSTPIPIEEMQLYFAAALEEFQDWRRELIDRENEKAT